MTVFRSPLYRGGIWLGNIGGVCALNAFVGLGETILMVEKRRAKLINSAIAFTAAVALNSILIPVFGAPGAAPGIFVPYPIKGTLRVAITRAFGWEWPWRALVKPWSAALAAVPLALTFLIMTAGARFELEAVGIYLAGYLIAWQLIGLDPPDRAVVDQLFHRR